MSLILPYISPLTVFIGLEPASLGCTCNCSKTFQDSYWPRDK